MINIKTCFVAVAMSLSMFSVIGCAGSSQTVSKTYPEKQIEAVEEKNKEVPVETKSDMLIKVQGNENTVVFQLNDSLASKSLYAQLPFEVEVEDYSTNEKIFYPPEELDITNAQAAEGLEGTLAYFSPWGNVVMYYGSFGAYNGLYELGHVVSGSEFIEEMKGTLQVDIATE